MQRGRLIVRWLAVALVAGALIAAFPRVFAFVELAARELRYLWWLVLIVALALWLIFGAGRKPRG